MSKMPVFFFQYEEHPRQIIIVHQASQKSVVVTLDQFTQLPDFHASFPSFDQALIFLGMNYRSTKQLLRADLLFGVECAGNYARYLVSYAEAQQPDLFTLSELRFVSFKTVLSQPGAIHTLYQHVAESCLFASSAGFFGPKFPVNLYMQRPFYNIGLCVCYDLLIGHATANQAIIRQPNLPSCFIEYYFSSAQMQQIWTNIHLADNPAPSSFSGFKNGSDTQNAYDSLYNADSADLSAIYTSSVLTSNGYQLKTKNTPKSLSDQEQSDASRANARAAENETPFGYADASPPPMPDSKLFQFMVKLTEQLGFSTALSVRCVDEKLLKIGIRTAQMAGFVVDGRGSGLCINLVTRSYLEIQYNNNYQYAIRPCNYMQPVYFIDITTQFSTAMARLQAKFQVFQRFKRRVFVAFSCAAIYQLIFSSAGLQMNFLRAYGGCGLSDMRLLFQGHYNLYGYKFIQFGKLDQIIRILIVDSTNCDDYSVEGIGYVTEELFEQACFSPNRASVTKLVNTMLPMPLDQCRLPAEFLSFDKQFHSKEVNYAKSRAQQLEKVLAYLQRIGEQNAFNQYSEYWDFLQKSESLPQIHKSAAYIECGQSIDVRFALEQIENNIILPIAKNIAYDSPFCEKSRSYPGVFILQASLSNAEKLIAETYNQFDFVYSSPELDILLATYYNYLYIRPEGLLETEIKVFHDEYEVIPENGNFAISFIKTPVLVHLSASKGTIQLNRLALKMGFYSPEGNEHLNEMRLFQPLEKPICQDASMQLLKYQQIVYKNEFLVRFRQFSNIHGFRIKCVGYVCLKIYVKHPTQSDYASSFAQLFKDTSCQLNATQDDYDLYILHVQESGVYRMRMANCIRLNALAVGADVFEIEWLGEHLK